MCRRACAPQGMCTAGHVPQGMCARRACAPQGMCRRHVPSLPYVPYACAVGMGIGMGGMGMGMGMRMGMGMSMGMGIGTGLDMYIDMCLDNDSPHGRSSVPCRPAANSNIQRVTSGRVQ